MVSWRRRRAEESAEALGYEWLSAVVRCRIKRGAVVGKKKTRVHICHVAKADDVERVSKMASQISKRFISKKI